MFLEKFGNYKINNSTINRTLPQSKRYQDYYILIFSIFKDYHKVQRFKIASCSVQNATGTVLDCNPFLKEVGIICNDIVEFLML